MFDSITINLTDPICKCKTENLAWGGFTGSNGRLVLKIYCKTCNTEIFVTAPALVAKYNIKNPYPNKQGTKAKLYSIDGGKT